MDKDTILSNPHEQSRQMRLHKLRITLIIFSAFLLMLIVGIGSIFLFQSDSRKDISKSAQPSTIPTQEAIEYETYNSSDEKFVITYPTNLFTRVICPEDSDILRLVTKNTGKSLLNNATTDNNQLTLNNCRGNYRALIEVNTYAIGFNEPTKFQYPEMIIENTSVWGLAAKKYSIPTRSKNTENAKYTFHIYVPYKNKKVEFYLSDSTYDEDFTRIVNSTKFFHITPTPTPVDFLTFPEKQFNKRFFNVNDKLYRDIGRYPEELTSVSENNLLSLFCYNLKPDYTPGIYYYSDGKYKDQGLLVDKKLQSLFTQLSIPRDPINTVLEICEVEDGRLIVKNEIHKGGGGEENKALFYIFDTTSRLNYVTTIPNDGAAYFTCRWPLQLTKTNFLYYKCGSGDGPSGSYSIYQINLNNNTNTGIYKCGEYYNETKKESYEKCQNFVNPSFSNFSPWL